MIIEIAFPEANGMINNYLTQKNKEELAFLDWQKLGTECISLCIQLSTWLNSIGKVELQYQSPTLSKYENLIYLFSFFFSFIFNFNVYMIKTSADIIKI